MSSFVNEIAVHIFEKYSSDFKNLIVIFPNRRASLFLRKELANLIDSPIWMPEILSLEDFIFSNQEFEKANQLELIIELFESYKLNHSQAESFDKFYFWGEMILKDFEEIDQYLVEPEQIFRSIVTQKELDEEFYFLDEEERKVIESFWHTFLPQTTQIQDAFLQTWKILKPVYFDFQNRLQISGKAYNGLVYRKFLENLNEGNFEFDKQIVFAGFNALTFSEEKIIKHFITEYNAEIIWDADPYIMSSDVQEAGFFLRQYARDPIFGRFFNLERKSEFLAKKDFSLSGVSLQIGQVKSLAENLQILSETDNWTPEKTVIVLPKENLLFSVLESLPESISQVNITMGYPLKKSTIFYLIDNLILQQELIRQNQAKQVSFNYRILLDVIKHPLIHGIDQKEVDNLINEVKNKNLIYVPAEIIKFQNRLLKSIFSFNKDIVQDLISVLEQLVDYWEGSENKIELQFIDTYLEYFENLNDYLKKSNNEVPPSFVRKLFRKISGSLKVPFTGEPLNGVQVMGILETRNLDFENVFVLDMNEDSWPAPLKSGSFIPYNIRKAFMLPTFEHQDGMYSYLFYSLLQRAHNINLYYNTNSEFNLVGDLSRFVKQIDIESPHTIKKSYLSGNLNLESEEALTIQKDDDVFKRMARFFSDYSGEDKRRITPTALDTYLTCKFKFYLSYVEEIREPDQIREDMDAMMFGNILHDSMEILYKDLQKQKKTDIVEVTDFFGLKAGISGAIKRAFGQHYNVDSRKVKFELEGRNVIAEDVISRMMNEMLNIDESYAPFRILGLEASSKDGLIADLKIRSGNETVPIGLKGRIDRIDSKEGMVRIIDYKTGRDGRDFKSIESLFDSENQKRNKAAFQLFFYSYIVENSGIYPYDQIEPGLFNVSDIFSEDFNWRIFMTEGTKTEVSNFSSYYDEFEEYLTELLTEIWNSEIPFEQTQDYAKCWYCPFISLCHRDTKSNF